MRKLILVFCLCSAFANAQPAITSHDLPPGYTNSQLTRRYQLKIDAANNKWVAFATIGLGKYDGVTWVVYDSLNSGLPSNKVTSLDFDPNGNMWVGTNIGAAFYNGISWQVYNTLNTGVPLEFVNSIIVKGTDVWFGTNAGAVKFNGSNWTSYSTLNSGIVNDTVNKIIPASNGKTWMATKQGVCSYDGLNWVAINSGNSILPVNDISDIADDAYGRIWVSPRVTNAVYYIEGDTIVKNFRGTIYTSQLDLSTSIVNFGKDDVNNIYFITNAITQAIVRITGNDCFFTYLSPYHLTSGILFGQNLEFDSNGTMWYLPNFSSPVNEAFKEINFWGYLPQPLLSPTVDNAKSLNINDARTLILNRGDMHWDPSSQDGAYEVPKGSGKQASYASALWIGGLDAGNNLHVAAQSYRQTGSDYWPGPIAGISQPFDTTSCVQFDKIFNVYRWQVEEFKTNFLNGSVSNGSYPVPLEILEWPATGNYGISDDKAPFVDFNSDNVYSPYDGDYPLIKGDQMLFWIFNDSLAEHSYTNPGRLGFEIHGSAYAFACPGIADSNQVLNRTTLYHYRIINRSIHDFHDVYLGLWNSSVIGNYVDNYMGCDTLLHAAFAYNSDNNDEGTEGYGLNPPMQNVVVLRGMLADAGDGIDNNLDGITDEPGEHTTMNHFMSADGAPGTPMSNPISDLDHYRYMQSFWLDGQHLSYGADGRDPSNPETNFLFSGTPYSAQWCEFTVGIPGGERKFVLGSGPVTLTAGGETEIDFAYVFTRDSLNPNGQATSVLRNIQDVQRIQSWFDTDSFPSCLNYNLGEASIADRDPYFRIYPNPAKDVVYAGIGNAARNDVIEVRDMAGRLVFSRLYENNMGLNISHLTDGIYTLRWIGKRSVRTGKFVKSG